MNVEQALRLSESYGSVARVLGEEVKRLREQLKKQEEDFIFYRTEEALYGTKYWICGAVENKKKMTIDQAIELSEGAPGSIAGELAEENNGLCKDIERRDKEIEILTEDREQKDKEIKCLREKIETLDMGFHRIHEFTDSEHRSATTNI